MGSVHAKFCKTLPVYAYLCESEEVPNQVPEKVCLHYKVLSHLRQFLSPLYEQHPEVSLMLMSSYPTQCHYIPRVDEPMRNTFSNDFLDTRNLRVLKMLTLVQTFFKMLSMCSSQLQVFGESKSKMFMRRCLIYYNSIHRYRRWKTEFLFREINIDNVLLGLKVISQLFAHSEMTLRSLFRSCPA